MQQGEPVLPEGCTSPSWQSCHGAPPHLPVRAPAGIDQAPSKEVDNATSAPSPFTLHARCFVCARLVRAAIGLAEASYAAALADYLRKKKSTLQHGALLECVAKAPGLAAAAQPLAVVAKEAGGAARNAYIQVRPPSHAHTCVCACVCVCVCGRMRGRVVRRGMDCRQGDFALPPCRSPCSLVLPACHLCPILTDLAAEPCSTPS